MIVILLIAFVLYLSFSPTSSAKRLVAKYNRWSDPGLIQGEGLGGLFKFVFLNKLASSKLSSVLSEDCKIIVNNYDGTSRHISGKDYVSGLTGIRFTSNVKQIILTKPEYESQGDNIIATILSSYLLSAAMCFYSNTNNICWPNGNILYFVSLSLAIAGSNPLGTYTTPL